ncbi:MAG: FMN-binding protein [Gammaproteobacteria bacterium]
MSATPTPAGLRSALAVQGVLVAIALVAGLVIASVHELTRPRVAAQRAALLADAVLDVLPGAVAYDGYALRADGRLERLPSPQDAALFVGRDGTGQRVGVAIAAAGMGYQDRIQLLYGVDPDAGRLLGLRVLESRETPGLGARIVDDAAFLQGFVMLQLQFDDSARVRPLRLARAGAEAGEYDGITGATVSARAVGRILSASLAEWLPRLRDPAALAGGHGDG